MRKYILIFLIIMAVVITLLRPLLFKTEEHTQFKMGTFVKITLQGPFWLDFDDGFKKTFAAIDKIDNIANIYDDNSEISRLNRIAYIKPVSVSDDLYAMVKGSIRLSQESDGAFDITVGPLAKLWSDYDDKGKDISASELKRALSTVGYRNLLLDEEKKSIFFKKRGVSIDLSAVAKGYAVDKAAEELRKEGIRSAIINAGGDLYCLGKRGFFQKWHIGIIDPQDKKRIRKVLHLSDKACATSGDYEQHFLYKGRDYTHVIDPITGYPKELRFSSVTILAPSCALADGLATAIYVGGESVKEKLGKFYPDIDIITID